MHILRRVTRRDMLRKLEAMAAMVAAGCLRRRSPPGAEAPAPAAGHLATAVPAAPEPESSASTPEPMASGDRLPTPERFVAFSFAGAATPEGRRHLPISFRYGERKSEELLLGDALREMELGFTLWFEPERVFPDTQLAREHPEWLLSSPGDASYLYNLGNPEARRFLTEKISALIAEAGVTCYRQDFNMEPAEAWRAADAPDRVGMSEIRHIEGLYAFWDELLARHPGLIIDNCASGGRRIDLETISRSVPLWRSDVQCALDFNPIAMQTQTQGLAPWVPLSAGCCRSPDKYSFRSALGPGMVVIWTTRALEEKVDFPERLPVARELLAELWRVRPYFYGDFFPLLPFSLSAKAWAAWQFHRADMGEGLVLALRRPQSDQSRLESPLRGLDPSARYELQNADTGEVAVASGSELLEKGVCIDIAERPGSALVLYRRVG